MNDSSEMIDSLTGQAKVPTTFERLDMAFRLRIRGFVGICMPPMFADLERRFPMTGMRRVGIAPVLYFVDFRNTPAPLSFGRSLHTDFTLRLCRSHSDRDGRPVPAGTGVERLMFESRTRIRGRLQPGGRANLGYATEDSELVEAGSARVLHVITRPAGPPEQRQVTTVPEALHGLREHAWAEPLPTVEALAEIPEGHEPVDTGGWETYRGVWGMPNTDINQHVNVLEYIMGLENQYTRQLHAGGLAVKGHRITRARMLFRKPFFPAQPYVIRSQLYRHGPDTMMVGGFYLLGDDGKVAQRPSVFTAMEGVLAGD
ncbi:MAG TPA: hypothetical protein VFA86_13525 [Gammaproteobacteria bacterium]|nr:hypothetical protein [Gammaproteobacteria bacterium]